MNHCATSQKAKKKFLPLNDYIMLFVPRFLGLFIAIAFLVVHVKMQKNKMSTSG